MKGQDHSTEKQASAYLAARREGKQRRAGIICTYYPIWDSLMLCTNSKLVLCIQREKQEAHSNSTWNQAHLPSVVTCFLQLGSICSEGNCVKWTLEKMPPAFTKFYKCPHDLDLSWLCQACLCESTLPFFFSACTLVLQFTFLLQWGGKNSNLTFYIEIQSGKEIQAPIIISISHLH